MCKNQICFCFCVHLDFSFSYQEFVNKFLKLVSASFTRFLFFTKMIPLQKIWEIFFISSRSWDIQLFVFPSYNLFLSVSHWFRAWSKINLKVYDVSNCLNKNLITHFVWYLQKRKRYGIENLLTDRLLTFLGKNHVEKVDQKLVPDLFFLFC